MKDCVIVSVYQGDSEYRDLKRHDMIHNQIWNRIQYEQVKGMYKGKKEWSFMFPSNELPLARSIGRIFNQECMMIVQTNRIGSLNPIVLFESIKSGYRTLQGDFVKVSKDRALKAEGYTYIPSSQSYYTIL